MKRTLLIFTLCANQFIFASNPNHKEPKKTKTMTVAAATVGTPISTGPLFKLWKLPWPKINTITVEFEKRNGFSSLTAEVRVQAGSDLEYIMEKEKPTDTEPTAYLDMHDDYGQRQKLQKQKETIELYNRALGIVNAHLQKTSSKKTKFQIEDDDTVLEFQL